MICTRFISHNCQEDVCDLIEKHLNISIGIEDWLAEQISDLFFEDLDFPYDMGDCVEYYFSCDDEETAIDSIHSLIEKYMINELDIDIDVYKIGLIFEKYSEDKEYKYEIYQTSPKIYEVLPMYKFTDEFMGDDWFDYYDIKDMKHLTDDMQKAIEIGEELLRNLI